MRTHWLLTLRACVFSLLLHLVIGTILFFSFDFNLKPNTPPKPIANIIEATAIDKSQVYRELNRLKEMERVKQEKERKLKQKLEDEKRKIENEKLRLKKQKEEDRKKRIAEEKKKKEETERKKQAEEKKKKEEAERKKRAKEEKKRKDEERKASEKALKAQLEAEEAQQAREDLSKISEYQAHIAIAIEGKFNRLGLEKGLSSVIQIKMIEGGEVVEAVVVKSSGNSLFDKRAESAVFTASPLPVPNEIRLFEKMRTIRITFAP